jgi:hypothetical protein
MDRRLSWLVIASVALRAAAPASAGLVVNLGFTSNFNTNFGASAASARAAANYAAQQFDNLFSDPISVNISVDAVTGTGTLGQSIQNVFGRSYTTLRNAVVSDAKSSDDATAIGPGGSVPPTDPTGGTGHWFITRAQEKALGLIPSDSTDHGTVTFGTGFTYAFDSNNRAVSGAIDFIGVVEPEISEILGRIGLSGQNLDGSPGRYIARCVRLHRRWFSRVELRC